MNKIPKIIYIICPGRSGSTMLDILLSNHPSIQGVGEVHRLVRYALSNEDTCTCGSYVSECDFWLGVNENAKKYFFDHRRDPLLDLSCDIELESRKMSFICNNIEKVLLTCPFRKQSKRIWKILYQTNYNKIINSVKWFHAIYDHTGTDYILDSTKDVRRLLALSFIYGKDIQPVFLIRDGRAVVYSMMKRMNISSFIATKMWKRNMNAILTAEKIFNRLSPFHRIYYESLCKNQSKEINNLFIKLKLEKINSPLSLKKVSAHNIAGSPSRFDKTITSVNEDLRWQSEMRLSDLRTFCKHAGKLNETFGYH
jgi:hypothetical protein